MGEIAFWQGELNAAQNNGDERRDGMKGDGESFLEEDGHGIAFQSKVVSPST